MAVSSNLFSMEVINRILRVLDEESSMKRTNLAARTRLNYLTCIRYINFLKSVGWIELTSDNGELISISQPGGNFRSILTKYLQRVDENNGASSSCDINEVIEKSFPDIAISKDFIVDTNQKLLGIEEPYERRDRRVMVVDDEKDLLFTYKSFLSEIPGCKVDDFSDPVEALRQFALEQFSYDLVIADIRMPTLNGLQLYRGFKAINAKIKFMFLSALDAADELVSVLDGIDARHILRKPVTRRQFVNEVNAILDASGLVQQSIIARSRSLPIARSGITSQI